MTKKIGFIGMGIMGNPMAANLLKSGADLMVFNRTLEKTNPLKKIGAKVAASPSELAGWADVIILMVTGPEAINSIVNGPGGILEAENEGKTLINMSTVSPEYSKLLSALMEKNGIFFIDAPVSGSKKPAEEGTLVVLAGGDKELVDRFEPLLLKMSKKVVYCGEAGKGSGMKMVVNLLLGIMMEGLCEAINLGRRTGLSMESMLDTLLSGPLGCGLFSLKTGMLESGDYSPQFPLKHMTKDIRFVLQTADNVGAAVPAVNAVFQVYRQAVGHQMGDLDFAAVKKILEVMSDR